MGVDVDFYMTDLDMTLQSQRYVQTSSEQTVTAVDVPFFFLLEASILQISDPISSSPCWSQILIFYSHPGLLSPHFSE